MPTVTQRNTTSGAAPTGARPSHRILLAGAGTLLTLLSLGVPAAVARPITDPVRGWPAQLRHELHVRQARTQECNREPTRAGRALQDRVDEPHAALRAAIDPHWGADWFDACDGGRLEIGIAPAPADELRRVVRRTRRLLDRRHLSEDTRIVAVRSTLRELDAQTDQIGDRLASEISAGQLEIAVDTTRNTVVIDTARGLPAQALNRVRTAAQRAPVNVVVRSVAIDDLAASATSADAQTGRCVTDVTVIRELPGVRLFRYPGVAQDYWACVPGARRARELRPTPGLASASSSTRPTKTT